MRKVKCTNGHFFDADRFFRCPICDAEAEHGAQAAPARVISPLPKTEPLMDDELLRIIPERGSRGTRRVDELAPTEKLRPEDEERLAIVAEQYRASMAAAETVKEEPAPSQEVQDTEAAEAVPAADAADAADAAEPEIPQAAVPAADAAEPEIPQVAAPAAAAAEPEVPQAAVPAADAAEPEVPQAAVPAVDAAEPEVPQAAVPAESAGRCQPKPLLDAVKATASTGISALPKTIAYYDFEEVIPPVGWLVCVKGQYLGQAFMCKAGRNKIGRGVNMEINLQEERSINRNVHAAIIYEPIQRQFFIQAGSGDGLTYLNGNLVFSHEVLHPYDKIAVGKLEFVFLPLCGEQFTWNDYMTEE